MGEVTVIEGGLVVLSVGVLGDVLIGDRERYFGRVPHPVVMMGFLVSLLDRSWNVARDEEGGVREDLDEGLRCVARRRGFLSLCVCVIVSGMVGCILWWWGWELGRAWGEVWFWIFEGVIVSVLIAGRSLYEHVVRVADAEGDLEKMREVLQLIVSRDASRLDKWGVGRGAFESLSDNYVDGVVGPLFWWVVGGLPGICVYKMVNTADSMVAYHGEPYRDYGKWVGKADDVMNIVPARLGALSVLCASFVMRGASGVGAWKMLRAGEMYAHRSPSAGWPEAAFAGALDLSLGGKRVYPGGIEAEHWVGRGRCEVTGGDIRKGLRLYVVASFFHWVLLLVLYGVLERFLWW